MNFLEFEKFCKKNKLKIFTINDVKILFDKYSPRYIRLKLNRWKKKDYIKTLKKGLYFFSDEKLDEFEIASKLITPSYISLETAFSHYSIIPDVSAQITAITTKNTRSFTINNISYHFYHIKPSLFTNFIHLREDILIAECEKAILDFFYFKNPGKNHPFFERLNKEILKDLNIKKMVKLSEKFPKYVQKSFDFFKNVITG